MTERYIPESAVRKVIRHAMDGEWSENDATARIMALATAAPQDEAPEPEVPAWAFMEALTPSGATKAAYHGEFVFTIEELDEDGDEATRDVTVPWTTIKKVMGAIRERAVAGYMAPSEPEGLREAAAELATAEANYREKAQLLGPSDLDTGRAWDRMRKAGDRVRSALALARPAAAEGVESKYSELLMAVARKHPGETRHETALRYIQQAESKAQGGQGCDAPAPDDGEQADG
jgi:hypothetical protein